MGSLNFDAIVSYLENAGFLAYVEQTGGGVATIYAASRSLKDANGHDHYGFAAGPGSFAGPGWTNAHGHTDDFYLGANDTGDSVFVSCVGMADERAVADAFIAVMNDRTCPYNTATVRESARCGAPAADGYVWCEQHVTAYMQTAHVEYGDIPPMR